MDRVIVIVIYSMDGVFVTVLLFPRMIYCMNKVIVIVIYCMDRVVVLLFMPCYYCRNADIITVTVLIITLSIYGNITATNC